MSAWRISTLRWRLMIGLLAVTVLSWIMVDGIGYHKARYEMDKVFDAELTSNARFLLSLTVDQLFTFQDMARIIRLSDEVHRYDKKLLVQIWSANGRLLLRSASAPDWPLATEDGFDEQVVEDRHWRVFSLSDPESAIRVQVAQALDMRRRLGHDIALVIWIPALLMLPWLAWLIWLVVGRAMAPLVQLTREVERREPGNLQPLPQDHVPGEVRPLVMALNTLLLRLGRALENERRFTADAAHELRTPLAALRIHAQVAERATNSTVRNEALGQLMVGIDRAAHLIEQLLTLARMDTACFPEPPQPIDPRSHAATALAAVSPLADVRHIELHYVEKSHSSVWLAPGAMDVLLRNLVDNALRYTPQGGRVAVGLEEINGAVRLWVADSGPGIPESERMRVFERFFRGEDEDSSGCGLGLSIVSRITELYGAHLKLERSEWGGLQVEVHFSLPAANAPLNPS